jgi:hypothetical protein
VGLAGSLLEMVMCWFHHGIGAAAGAAAAAAAAAAHAFSQDATAGCCNKWCCRRGIAVADLAAV